MLYGERSVKGSEASFGRNAASLNGSRDHHGDENESASDW